MNKAARLLAFALILLGFSATTLTSGSTAKKPPSPILSIDEDDSPELRRFESELTVLQMELDAFRSRTSAPSQSTSNPANESALRRLEKRLRMLQARSKRYTEQRPGRIADKFQRVEKQIRIAEGNLQARTKQIGDQTAQVNTAFPHGWATATGASPTVDITAMGTGAFAGTVTAASGGAPIAGVTIYVYDSSISYLGTANSGPTGTYTFSGLSTGTYYAQAWSWSGFYVPQIYDQKPYGTYTDFWTPIDVIDGQTTTNIDFPMDLGGKITGTFSDSATSLPLGGWTVDVYHDSGDGYTTSYCTACGSTYSTIPLPPGTYYISGSFTGYLTELYNDIDCALDCDPTAGTAVTVTAGAETPNIDFALDPAGTISGHVYDASTNDPLQDVRVTYYDDDYNWLGSDRTDSSGWHECPVGLPAGTYRLYTSNSLGYVDEEVWADVTEQATTTVNFFLEKGAAISGTVTDVSGTPLYDPSDRWAVAVEVYDSTGSYVGNGYTDATGTYTIDGLPAGTVYARTYNDLNYIDEVFDDIPCLGYCSASGIGDPILVVAGSTETVNFELQLGGSISGTITDDATGNPLYDPTDRWAVRARVYDSSGSQINSAYADDLGQYTVGGLPTGTYFVRTSNYLGYVDENFDNITCVGWCDFCGSDPVGVTQGSTASGIDFALEEGGLISGTVTSASTGDPVYDPDNPWDNWVDIYDSNFDYVTYGEMDSSGYYETYDALPTGDYYAFTYNSLGYFDELYDDVSCAEGCSYEDADAITLTSGGTATANFALDLGGRISGTLTDDDTGTPLPSTSVTVYDSNGNWTSSGYTDDSGNYSTGTGLLTGLYYVKTRNNIGYLDELYPDIPCMDCDPTDSGGTQVDVTMGATTTGVDLALETGGSISGTVTDQSDGTPLYDVYMRIHDASGNYITYDYTDGTGHYQSRTGLSSGQYFVTTRNREGYVDELFADKSCPGSNCVETAGDPVSVTYAQETANTDFALSVGGVISGTVTDALSGYPLCGWNIDVQILDLAGNYLYDSSVDLTGRYESCALPTGSYYAGTWNGLGYVNEFYDNESCAVCNLTTVSADPIGVVAPSITPNIDFDLDFGGSISGTVTAVGGLPLDDAWIAIFDSTGTQVERIYVDAFGSYTTRRGLLTGDYYAVTGNNDGFLNQLHSGQTCIVDCDPTDGTEIPVTLGYATDVDFVLTQVGSISGTVTDASTDESLRYIDVEIWDAGGTKLGVLSTGYDGSYQVNLPPGTYYVSTYNDEGFMDELYNGLPCLGGGSVGCNPTDGNSVVVTSGSNHADVDFALSMMDLVLNYMIVDKTKLFEAMNSITAGSECSILFPGDVTFRAGTRIVLGDGFSVGPDTMFTAAIDPTMKPK